MDYAVVMNDLKTSVALHDESFSFSKSLCTLFLWRFSLLPIFALMRAPSIFMFPQTPSVQFSRSVMSDSLWPHELQHIRPPCPSPTLGIYPNSYLLSWWCHPAISSSVIPFSSCPQSFPASGSFQMSQFFASGGQSKGVSASTSVLPMNTQDWSRLEWTGWIPLQSKGLSRVLSNTTVQNKHHDRGLNSGWSHKGSSTFWPRSDRCLSCLQPIDQH